MLEQWEASQTARGCSVWGRSSPRQASNQMSLRKPYTEVFLHLVWGTWRRHGFITADLRERLYASMIHHATELGADVVALGGMPDHVHLLVRMPMTISIAEFVRRVKGGSSHFVTRVLEWPEPFKWLGGY